MLVLLFLIYFYMMLDYCCCVILAINRHFRKSKLDSSTLLAPVIDPLLLFRMIILAVIFSNFTAFSFSR